MREVQEVHCGKAMCYTEDSSSWFRKRWARIHAGPLQSGGRPSIDRAQAAKRQKYTGGAELAGTQNVDSEAFLKYISLHILFIFFITYSLHVFEPYIYYIMLVHTCDSADDKNGIGNDSNMDVTPGSAFVCPLCI